jgi:hypothetical protein
MANLQNAVDLTKALLNETGLTAQGWKVILTRAKYRAGVCKHRNKEIGISAVVTPTHTEDAVWNTITHEVAHALVGTGHGHDHVWKNKHRELGGNAKRCYDNNSYIGGAPPEHLTRNRSEDAKYKGTCPSGHVHYRYKMPIRKTSCGQCSRRYDERYLITFGLNR